MHNVAGLPDGMRKTKQRLPQLSANIKSLNNLLIK